MRGRRLFELDPLGLLVFSGRSLFRGLPALIQINVWGLLLSLPLVTLPAARAGVYYAVREWLLDHLDGSFTPRQAFFVGFRRHFVRSTLLVLVNLAIGAVIVFSFFFWLTAEVALLNYFAAVSVYFFVFWWVMQPFTLPLLVEMTDESPLRVLRLTAKLVVSTPLYAILTGLLVFGLNLIGAVLFGPVLLILGAFVALLTTQAFWVMTDRPLPTWGEKEA